MKIRPHIHGEQYFIVPKHHEREALPAEFDDVTKYLGEDGEETLLPGASFRTSPLPITLMRVRDTVIHFGVQDGAHVVLHYGDKKVDVFELPRPAFEKFMEYREQIPFDLTPYHRIGNSGKVHVYTVRPSRALKLKGWKGDGTILSGKALLEKQKRG